MKSILEFVDELGQRIEGAMKDAYESGHAAGEDAQRDRELLVMNEFVESKGEDYPLGKYLNMKLGVWKIKKEPV